MLNGVKKGRPVIGREYNWWTALSAESRRSMYKCRCGNERNLLNYHVLSGASKMCRSCHAKNRKYGGSEEGISRKVWRRLRTAVNDAIFRCTDPESNVYHHYGGRGIGVYGPWLVNKREFVLYLASLDGHDNPQLWLDREDNNRGYVPGNLRFVTPSVSMKNRRFLGRRRVTRRHGDVR